MVPDPQIPPSRELIEAARVTLQQHREAENARVKAVKEQIKELLLTLDPLYRRGILTSLMYYWPANNEERH